MLIFHCKWQFSVLKSAFRRKSIPHVFLPFLQRGTIFTTFPFGLSRRGKHFKEGSSLRNKKTKYGLGANYFLLEMSSLRGVGQK